MSVAARRYYRRGLAALERGELEAAIEAFRSAVELVPRFSSARIGHAVALAKSGDCPWAAQSLRAGLAYRASPTASAALWVTLGDVLTMSGDFLGAKDAFEQAARVPGFEARVAAGLARVYGKLGRYDQAMQQLRTAARLAAGSAPRLRDGEADQ